MIEHRFNYNWRIKDNYPAKNIAYHGKKVFSCFACGGGSTMGYKLAGYDVLGCNEIDPKMIEVYKLNHNPKYAFCEPIQVFKNRTDLPEDLFNLDILDFSPPCSTFAMCGNREKDWGKKKKFREGQAEQVLDTLFFDAIDLAKKLQPKVCVAENVKGLLLGNAKNYVKRIMDAFEDAGYIAQYFLLDASKMGVPQKRERVFFIAIRKDISNQFMQSDGFWGEKPYINMLFTEKEIPIKEFVTTKIKKDTQNYSKKRYGDILLKKHKPSATLTTDINRYWIDENNLIDDNSICLIGSYPLDYNFLNNKVQYLVGMSVPPVMMANVSLEIYNQWLCKLL